MAGADVSRSLAFTPERFADRLAEAIRVSNDPGAFARLPQWTQRVMLILKEQLVPPQLTSMLMANQAIFGEGVCVAWIAHARDILTDPGEGQFARKVAERLTRAPEAKDVVNEVAGGTIVSSPEFREHVMHRLFAASAAERRAFAEGLALGNRVYELFAQHTAQRRTDATAVYLLLWLYWPEISRMRSIGQTARMLEGLFGHNRNLAGQHWDERFRKIANRIGLSFRAKQKRAGGTPVRRVKSSTNPPRLSR